MALTVRNEQGDRPNDLGARAQVGDGINTVLADAPASYPHIWNTSQQPQLQWNGIAPRMFKLRWLGESTELGALVRNTVTASAVRPCILLW